MYSMVAKCEWLLPGCMWVVVCRCVYVCVGTYGCWVHMCIIVCTYVHACVYVHVCMCGHLCGHMCSYQDFFLLAVDCSVVDDKHLSCPAFRKKTMKLITPQPSAFTGNLFCISVSSECKRLGIVTVLDFTEVLKSFFFLHFWDKLEKASKKTV